MVDPIAQPTDVKKEIDTVLSNSRITDYLEDAAFENDRANGADSQSDELRKRIERKLAALKIIERRERSVSTESRESASVTYEASMVDALKREIQKLDDSGELVSDPKPQADFEVF